MLNEDIRDKSFPQKWVGPGSSKTPQPEVKRFYVEEKFEKITKMHQGLEERRRFLLNMLKDIFAETEANNPNIDLQKSQKLYLRIKEELEEIREKEKELTQEILQLIGRENLERRFLEESPPKDRFDG